MPAKKISIGHGYEIRFDQRAKGEETRYWVGTIFKNGKEVGGFSNNGNGGATHIHSTDPGVSVENDFLQIIDESAKRQGFDDFDTPERESILFEVAEAIGYNKDAKQFTNEPQLVIDEFVLQDAQNAKIYGKS